MSRYNAYQGNQHLDDFNKLAKRFAIGIVAAGGLAWGGYAIYQNNSADALAVQARAVQAKVEGASAIKERELSILTQRAASSQEAMDLAQGRRESMEFLVGKAPEDLAANRANLIATSKSRIEKAAALEAALKAVPTDAASMSARSKSDTIDKLEAILGTNPQALAAMPSFSGPAGFASQSVANFEIGVRSSVEAADAKLAAMDKALPEAAALLTPEAVAAIVEARVGSIQTEARASQAAAASAQIEQHRQNVRSAAEAAFRREGESMGQSDWNEINNDLERDRDWIGAKAGLMQAGAQTADQAAQIAREQWEDEGAHALALAQVVSSDPASIQGLTLWERAALYQWLQSAPSTTVVHYVEPPLPVFAGKGYSLTGTPRPELNTTYAIQSAQGLRFTAPVPRYTASNLSTAVAYETAKARADAPSIAALEAKAAGARAALMSAKADFSKPNSGYATTVSPTAIAYAKTTYVFKPDAIAGAAALAATKSATAAAQASASKAALLSAKSAAGSAAAHAADSAAAKSAALAAQSAAGKAAASAASTAASKAATSAASTAASKAASAAASKAASAAASKAASAAASKAASAAASKAASAAASKAASAASSKAASTASSKASTMSSSSRK